MVFNKYFSSNLSDCVLGTEESQVPRAAFKDTPCHPMPMVMSRASNGKDGLVKYLGKAPASKPDDRSLTPHDRICQP